MVDAKKITTGTFKKSEVPKLKDVDKKEHYEISWSDDGSRRHQKAYDPKDAQEVARGFIEDHELNDVAIHKITTIVEPIKIGAKS